MNKRSQARQWFIEAVKEEMKDLDKEYNHQRAKDLIPMIRMASDMAEAEIEKLRKRRAPKRMEAAE